MRRPIGAPTPAIPTHTPTAFPLSSGGKTTTITESVAGITRAAPSPINPLAPITCSEVVAYWAVSADTKPTIASPTSNACFLPNLSPKAPITRSKPPNTITYASMIHCNSVLSAPNSFESSGRATLTVTLFRRVITRLRLIIPRINQRLLWIVSESMWARYTDS